MLNFFRKLRRKEMKGTRYLKYAIGEIALVVVGILIALQVNIRNENRKKSILADTYMTRIAQDLEQLITGSSELSTQNRETLKSITKTQSFLERGTPLSPDEVLVVDYAMLWFPRTTYQIPAMLTYEEMKESGNLNLIYNVELRSALAELYSFLKQVESIYVKLGGNIESQFDIYGKYIRSTTDPQTLEITFDYDFKAMSKDIEFINTFSRMAVHWRGFVFFMEGIKKRGEVIKNEHFQNE